MTPLLTTITPFWQRPAMLRSWVDSILASRTPEIFHHIFFVGESIPDWWKDYPENFSIIAIEQSGPPENIGYYHDLGASLAATEWIMKLDIDAVPNPEFFKALIPILKAARPREWFNCGMVMVKEGMSNVLQQYGPTLPFYKMAMAESGGPVATNFICRREDYLALGGCSPEFKGWGWEDYQQTYMLEKHWRGEDPLPGPVTMENVTQRCRDEISRPKARELLAMNENLCLLHRWHEKGATPDYKNPAQTANNRRVLLDYITARK